MIAPVGASSRAKTLCCLPALTFHEYDGRSGSLATLGEFLVQRDETAIIFMSF
jgi:hypothetical protein